MDKLIFEVKGDERKWNEILAEFYNDELAKECLVEYDATAKGHSARVHFLNYKNNPELINKLAKSENIISAYIINNKDITKNIR
ncbi:MAG: hypothetical protein DRJ07_04115 [Bacteroidetes bacterium]|nr:MAG: hypothetical protein DRJ07_04115 [Bacteroidota bacterium]